MERNGSPELRGVVEGAAAGAEGARGLAAEPHGGFQRKGGVAPVAEPAMDASVSVAGRTIELMRGTPLEQGVRP